MTGLVSNRWLSISVRIALGIVFVYSAWPKLADPPGFAHAVWNYRILPPYLVNLMAIFLPWLELLAGVALASGICRKGAALIVMGSLLVFICALALNLVRNNAVDCGCFSIAAALKTHEELLTEMKLDIVRDSGLLLLAIQAFLSPVSWRKLPDQLRHA